MMNATKIEKLVKKNEMDDSKSLGNWKVGKLVKKIDMGDPRVGNMGVVGK